MELTPEREQRQQQSGDGRPTIKACIRRCEEHRVKLNF